MSAQAVSYKTYFKAWLVLLAITLTMVVVGSPALLIFGMCAKAAIIALWFMHLRYERIDFTLYVLLGMFATAIILYALTVPDGRAM